MEAKPKQVDPLDKEYKKKIKAEEKEEAELKQNREKLREK